MNIRSLGGLAAVVVAASAHSAFATFETVSIKFTTDALGLGSTDINGGNVVNADIAGKFVTSPIVGMASILTVQHNGLAGSTNVLARVTARSHLDTLTGLTAPNDYYAGNLYITHENNNTPDGKGEGLGVRPFTVSTGTTSPLRVIDSSTGRAKIEGSKEISGGTGPSVFDPTSPNGAPHVDEDVLVSYDPSSQVFANSIIATVSLFSGSTDALILTVNLVGGGVYQQQLGATSPAFSTPASNSDVWNINFANLGFGAGDVATSFSVRAIDPDPAHPSGTAEHFLLTGFTATIVPTPASAMLLTLGSITAMRRRRR